MDDKKNKTLAFKVTEDFKIRLDNLAKEEKRSTSNLVIKILTEYMERIDQAKKTLETR